MNRLSAALATVVVLALAGCGGSTAPTAKYGSVSELRDAAVAAGYACPSWTQDNVVEFAAESGRCSDADVFMTYASPEKLEAAVDQAKARNRLLARKNIEPGTNLVGENWIINSKGAVDLQAKLGGTILR